MKRALPSIVAQMVDQKSSQQERASRVKRSKILGVETSIFVVSALTAWWICCVAGLIMIANYEDQGQLQGVSLYIVAIPFMMGPLIVFVLLYNFARRSWTLYSAKNHPRKDQRRLKQHLETAVGGDLKLTTNALKQLERTTSATPDDAKDFFVTKHQTSSTGEASTAGEVRGVGSGDGSSAVQEATTAMVMVDITGVDASVVQYSKYCEDNIWGPLLAFTTLSMPCVTALLFAAGASATVAFIPLMVASCVPIVLVVLVANCKEFAIFLRPLLIDIWDTPRLLRALSSAFRWKNSPHVSSRLGDSTDPGMGFAFLHDDLPTLLRHNHFDSRGSENRSTGRPVLLCAGFDWWLAHACVFPLWSCCTFSESHWRMGCDVIHHNCECDRR